MYITDSSGKKVASSLRVLKTRIKRVEISGHLFYLVVPPRKTERKEVRNTIGKVRTKHKIFDRPGCKKRIDVQVLRFASKRDKNKTNVRYTFHLTPA